jgi:cytochrome P450
VKNATCGISVKGVPSLTQLLDPETLANPYPLYSELRAKDPVCWDPYLHAWVATRYADVVTILRDFSAARVPSPESLAEIGLDTLAPATKLMTQQMLFMDPPSHARVRALSAQAFAPKRVEALRGHVREIVHEILSGVCPGGRMDVIRDLAEPMPYKITAEMLGVPAGDAAQLKAWSKNFAQVLGNFQHGAANGARIGQTLEDMTEYFRAAVDATRKHPREGLIHSFINAAVDGDRFTDDEIVANTIITMVGGQETTTNLIGNGILTLLRHPSECDRIRKDRSLIPSAIEEMLRFEPPSQYTARLAPCDVELGGKRIAKRQGVVAVLAAANRDPDRFSNPDEFDVGRRDNRHLSFGWAAHFCFGATLARVEGQVVLEEMFDRFSSWSLDAKALVWRDNLGLRGLTSLPITVEAPTD